MFWNRKTQISNSSLGPILSMPAPAKKEFTKMLDILRSAEELDSLGHTDAAAMTLKSLVKGAQDFIDEAAKQ
jgi:hypothetical protein